MSKAVSISEGGKGRIFPQTDKLKINNVGGGNSLWLPEDEVVTGTLYADENGIYLAENDGFSCYDTVVVRVEDETDPDDPDWELDPDDLDEDVWDEESLEEFQEDPEAFEEKFNDKEKWKAEKAKKEKSQKIKKVKSLKPSKITGIDPVDGNPYEVGVDEEGNLTKEMLPSSIHIVVPPWKREYENGEEINFYGMHVYLLDKDGHPFKTEQYPTGEIPFEELLLPVTIADGSEQSEQIGSSDIFPDGVAFSSTGILTYLRTYGPDSGQTFTETLSIDGAVTLFMVSVYSWRYLFSSKSDSAVGTFIDSRTGEIETATMHHSITHNGKTAYYTSGTVGWGRAEKDVLSVSPSADPAKWGLVSSMAWTMLYGNITGGGQEIPVQWMRSDGEMLSDSFYITVTDSGSDTNNSSSSNSTSDSGSGHTSGGF